MEQDNIRVAVSGVTGRMGRELIKFLLSLNSRSIVLTGAITRSYSKFIGYDVGSLISNELSFGVLINDSVEDIHKDFDVLIDFSCTQSALKYLNVCKIYKKNIVIGTTGFTKEELLIIQSASSDIGIVFSPNFSVMINLMLKLLKKSAFVLDRSLDVEILEMHHRRKRDIPSGTALRMREEILSGFLKDNDIQAQKCFLREKRECNIKINSMRVGDVIGEHSVFFVDFGERLELTHRVFDRKIFASGAVRAATWLGKGKIGLFDMLDVLGVDDF